MNKELISKMNLKEKRAVFNALSAEDKQEFLKNIYNDECYNLGINAQDQETFDLIVKFLISNDQADKLAYLSTNTEYNIDEIMNYFLKRDNEFYTLARYLKSSLISEEIRNKIKEYLLKHYKATDFASLKMLLFDNSPKIDAEYKKELLKVYCNSDNNDASPRELLELCSKEYNLLDINLFLQELARQGKDKALKYIINALTDINDKTWPQYKKFIENLKNSISEETITLIVELFLFNTRYLFFLENKLVKNPILKEYIIGVIANNISPEELERRNEYEIYIIYDYIIFKANNKATLFKKFKNERLSLEAIKKWVESGMDLEVAHYSSFLLNNLSGTDEEIALLDYKYNELLLARENNMELDSENQAIVRR